MTRISGMTNYLKRWTEKYSIYDLLPSIPLYAKNKKKINNE